MPGAEAAAQLEHRALVEQRLDHAADVVDALALLRDQLAQQRPGRAARPGSLRAVEVGEVALGRGDRRAVVGDAQVDDAVGVLHVDRADLARLVHAQAAALDHRRAAHADARVLARDHHVAAAEQRGVAGEAVARGDADERHEAAEPREQREGAAVQPGDDRHVDVARAPAAALGEQHDRQPAPLGDLEQPVLLGVVAHPLRAGEHRVVVGHRHARAAVDLADARDEPVGGRARDQLLARAPALLRGEQQRPVLDEACPRRRRSARFSRAVRRPRSRRRATASGRAASSPIAWRSRTASQVGAEARSREAVGGGARRRRGCRLAVAGADQRAAPGPPRRRRRPRPRRCARRRRPRASTSCSIFIASSTTSGAPAPTCSLGLRGRPRRRRPRTARSRLALRAAATSAADHCAARRAGRAEPARRNAPATRRTPATRRQRLPSGDVHGARANARPPSGARRSRRCSRRRKGCARCPELAATRKTVVFGAGNADADLMFVGEAPGASEDEQGVPFVGRGGKAARDAARGDRTRARGRVHRERARSAGRPATATRCRSRSRTARSTCCARSS